MAVGGAVDQLGGDAHAVARLAHAAFEHMGDLELPRDLRQIDMPAFERESRIARDDGERADLAEVGDDVFADAVGEVFLLLVIAHVGEGKDADRQALGLRRPARNILQMPRQGRDQLLERPAVPVLVPPVQIGGVDGHGVDRQLRLVEAHRHQHVALGAEPGFPPHPTRSRRRGRPDHDDGLGCLDLVADQLVELLAGRDRRVPPHRPALRLQRGDKRRDARLVRPRIGNEDVGHQASPTSVEGFSPPRRATPLWRDRGAVENAGLSSDQAAAASGRFCTPASQMHSSRAGTPIRPAPRKKTA